MGAKVLGKIVQKLQGRRGRGGIDNCPRSCLIDALLAAQVCCGWGPRSCARLLQGRRKGGGDRQLPTLMPDRRSADCSSL